MLLRQWVHIAKVIHSGEHQGRCRVGEGAGALTSFSQGRGTLHVWALTPTSLLFRLCWTPLADNTTVTSRSCPLGHLNFNIGNYVFPKNNILIKCRLEPDRSGDVTLQKKRQGSQDLELKVRTFCFPVFQSCRELQSLRVL